MAADHATPHFHNQPGVRSVRVGAKEFMCIGALPPFDHPHIFIDMGDAARLEIKLKPGNRWTKGTQCRGSVLLVSSEGLRIVIPVNITVAPF